MPEITQGDAHLFYDDVGAGPAVLFSHSWFCDGRQWPQVPAVVGAGHRVLNLDNRGHGRSGPYRRRFSMWDLAEDIVAVLDDAGVDQAVLVGLSVGGFASLRAALRHPDRVRALVLADTAASTAAWQGRVKATLLGPVARTPARGVAVSAVVNQLFGPTARRDQPHLVAEWRQRFLDQDVPSMLAAIRSILARDDVSTQVEAIEVPTLVIVGDEDRDPGVLASTALAALITAAQLVVMPGTGHLSALERPEAFTGALLDFLAGLPA